MRNSVPAGQRAAKSAKKSPEIPPSPRELLEAAVWRILGVATAATVEQILRAADGYAAAWSAANVADVPSPGWRAPASAVSGPGPTAEYLAARRREQLAAARRPA